MHDISNNQLKLEVHDTHEKDEKLTKNFEAVDDTDVLNETYLDKKLSKIDGHLGVLEKYYNDFNLHNKKDLVTSK